MKTTAWVALVFLFLLVAGCNDDDDTCPTCPKDTVSAITPDPTIQNIWPNEDKMAWTFMHEMKDWTWAFDFELYPTEAEVPPLPDWPEIIDLLDGQQAPDSFATAAAIYRMRFDSLTTTDSGATGQNLIEESYTEVEGRFRQLTDGYARSLLGRLFMARHDLRERILHYAQSRGIDLPTYSSIQPSKITAHRSMEYRALVEKSAQMLFTPLLLHGGAWEKTTEWIGTYGDLDLLLAWKFLTDELSPGTEFVHQLVPDLADDVFLHARVHRQLEVETEAGTFENAVDCLYIVDYGISYATDTNGKPLGYYRMFDYGRVIYAPTVGPVISYERMMVTPGDPPTAGAGEQTLGLVGSSTLGR